MTGRLFPHRHHDSVASFRIGRHKEAVDCSPLIWGIMASLLALATSQIINNPESVFAKPPYPLPKDIVVKDHYNLLKLKAVQKSFLSWLLDSIKSQNSLESVLLEPQDPPDLNVVWNWSFEDDTSKLLSQLQWSKTSPFKTTKPSQSQICQKIGSLKTATPFQLWSPLEDLLCFVML